MFKIAITGCPNVGKTTLFNLLTGEQNKTGNWEGVTVEVANAKMLFSQDVQIFDLPGIRRLSVTNLTQDQAITLNFLQQYKLDLIVNVVSAENIKRDLQLSMELYESGTPILMIITDHHQTFENPEQLEFLNCDVIYLDFQKKGIIKDIIKQIYYRCLNHEDSVMQSRVEYDAIIGYPQNISDENALLAIKEKFIEQTINNLNLSKKRNKGYNAIIDSILLHKFFAIPIFCLIVCIILSITILGGNILKVFFENLADIILIKPIIYLLRASNVSNTVVNLYQNGIGSGIKTIVSFIPLLGILYTLLGLLDDSGYMARISIVMENLTSKIGLSGKSIIPLILGFGCNVPAIMGARIIENQQQRILTVMLIPFMSCSARLTVFALFASAFFPKNGPIVICCLYFFSIFLACIIGFALKGCFITQYHKPLWPPILPKYRVPHFAHILQYSIKKIKHFIRDTGKVIIIMSLGLYLLASIDLEKKSFEIHDSIQENSLLVVFGKKASYLFTPLGIEADNWPATVSLFTGIIAKEVVVSTLVTLYQINETTIIDPTILIQKFFHNETKAFAYLLFILIYFPCITVFSVMRHEVGIKLAVLSSIMYTMLAYIISAIFYQISLYTDDSIILSLATLVALIMLIGLLFKYTYKLLKA